MIEDVVTARQIAKMILALPREQQNVPLIYEFYDDSNSSVPLAAKFESIKFCETGYPVTGPHIELET